MNWKDFKKFLEENKGDISWMQVEEDLGSVYLRSEKWGEIIRIDLDKLEKINGEQIKKALVHGKDVIQMTRVTGFYSLIRNWNPGKVGELKDRYRINKMK